MVKICTVKVFIFHEASIKGYEMIPSDNILPNVSIPMKYLKYFTKIFNIMLCGT